MITERIIHAGNTPLFSNFTVTQTGPMQLTVSGGDFQITGQASIMKRGEVPPAFFTDGRAELMPDGVRARVWHQDKVTKVIKDRSKRRTIVESTVVNILSHPTKARAYEVNLLSPSDILMQIQVDSWLEDQPDVPQSPNYTHILVFRFVVPPATTNLSGIDIRVLKVLPGFPIQSPEWEVVIASLIATGILTNFFLELLGS